MSAMLSVVTKRIASALSFMSRVGKKSVGSVVAAVFLLLLILSGWLIFYGPKSVPIHVNGQNLTAVILDSYDLQVKGLSGKDSLPQDQVYAFPSLSEDPQSIWMKGMKFNIDAVWLGEDAEVIHIEKSLRSSSYPHVYSSGQKSYYVIEMNEGLVDKVNIKIGTKIEGLPK